MWGFSAHREAFASANLETASGEDLKTAVEALVDDWHPALQRLVCSAEPSTITAFSVKTSVPISPWRTGKVTLLGDALHNMTPFRGIGANAALRDAAALRKALGAADRGEQDLILALSRLSEWSNMGSGQFAHRSKRWNACIPRVFLEEPLPRRFFAQSTCSLRSRLRFMAIHET